MPWSRICVHYYAHYTQILPHLFAEHFQILPGDSFAAVFLELSGLSRSPQTAVITLGLPRLETRLIGGKKAKCCAVKDLENLCQICESLVTSLLPHRKMSLFFWVRNKQKMLLN